MPDFFLIPELPILNLPRPERSLASPYLSGGTAHSAGPTQNPGNLVLWTKISDFSGFLTDFLPLPKNTKNQAPPKTSKNHKSPALGRPGLRFSSILDGILASIFHEISNSPKPRILQQVSSESSVFTMQGLPFWHQKSIKISCFSRNRSRTSFSPLVSNMMTKNAIFGPSSVIPI